MEAKVKNISRVSEGQSEFAADLFLSQPAAGFPALGDDSVDGSLDLNTLMVRNPTATFFVKVAGDSMEGARIFNGDILVIDRSVQPQSGDIVVAAINGELVVKRLVKSPSGMTLCSENDAYTPIVLTESDDCFIWGVVTGSVRKLS